MTGIRPREIVMMETITTKVAFTLCLLYITHSVRCFSPLNHNNPIREGLHSLTNEETERGKITCPKLDGWLVAETL